MPRAARDPRALRSRLAAALAAIAMLLVFSATTTVGATTYATTCDGINIRTGPGTTYAIKQSLSSGTKVSVVATVSGGAWSATCAGKSMSGSTWYRISAVNGTSVSTLYGVTYVYGATGLFTAVATATATPTPTSSGSPSPTPSPGPTTLPASITFYGRGYGHGVGMSQYGAYGRALAGQTYQTILAHYYKGEALGTMTNAQVRVLVLQSWTAAPTNPLLLYGLSGTWTIDGISTVFPAGAAARLYPTIVSSTSTTWRLVITASNGTKLYDAASSGAFRMRPAASTTVLQLYSKPSAYDHFRGVLRIIASATAPTISVVNELPMESYLQGVVPSEMSSAWPAQALDAQAIAARSYAAYRLHPTSGTYDLYDDTRSQVYHGTLGENATTTAAVTATAGVVMKSGTAIVDALYHSTGGGATESNQYAFVSANGSITSPAVSYLQGSSDRAPDGSAYDKLAPYATWHTATYTLAQVQAMFAADSRTNVGTLVALDLTRRGVSGRLISVTLIGADGTTKTVSGGVFTAVFNAQRPSADGPMRDTMVALAPIP